MATRQIMVCDLCGETDNVDTVTIVWNYGRSKPYELDLCQRCYKNRLGDLAEKGRRAQRNNTRPQARIKKTEITEDML